MKKFLKHEYLLIAFGVILFVVLSNVSGIFGFMKYVISVLLPVLAGFLIAFILNVPMRGFENLITRIFKKLKWQPGARLKRFAALILTFIALVGVVVLAISLVIPMLIESIQNIYISLRNQLPEIVNLLEKFDIPTDKIVDWVNENTSVSDIVENYVIPAVKSYAFPLIKNVVTFAAGAVSGVFTGFMVLFIAIYALLAKDVLARQTKRVLETFIKEKTREKIYYATNLLNYKYYKYLSGQFIEACILGIFGFTVLAVFGVPNAFIIAFITAILAFVPYVGAFSAFGIGAVLTLISAPDKLLTFAIIYFVVQIIETQLICPHVVGNAVGLSPLWTLAAVFIGGNLFGFIGIVMFIPLFSVGVTLLHEYVDNKIGPDPEAEKTEKKEKRSSKKEPSSELEKDTSEEDNSSEKIEERPSETKEEV